MADTTPRLYEGLFLINPQAVAGDIDGAITHVQEMLDRAGAVVKMLRRWDERKLAYTIDGQKRGVFLLSLFEVAPVQIANIERDCNLSEQVLRVMMTRGDHMGEVEITAALEDQKTGVARANLEADSAPADGGVEAEDAEVEAAEA